MIDISNIHLSYKKNQVLRGLNLQLPEGTVQGIAGLNGSGKTTLLNTIYQKLKPDQGTIIYNGQPLKRQYIAYLETHNYFYSRITGGEYLGLFKANNPDFDIKKWNDLFSLPLDHLTDTYSTGMKKKLAFMGILSLQRPIFILDEPFNGLDLETNENLKAILRVLKSKGKTIIITSHILETLTTICDNIHYLNQGVIEQSFSHENYEALAGLLNRFQDHNIEALLD